MATSPQALISSIRFTVDEYRIAAKMSVQRLSDVTGISRSTLRRKLKRPEDFTVAEIGEIAQAIPLPAAAFDIATEAAA